MRLWKIARRWADRANSDSGSLLTYTHTHWLGIAHILFLCLLMITCMRKWQKHGKIKHLQAILKHSCGNDWDCQEVSPQSEFWFRKLIETEVIGSSNKWDTIGFKQEYRTVQTILCLAGSHEINLHVCVFMCVCVFVEKVCRWVKVCVCEKV